MWEVSSVLGISAPGQQHRSFLAYIERERVIPCRPFIHYNSWYKLNISRNNDSAPARRMTEEQSQAVLKDWQEQFFQTRGMTIDAFVDRSPDGERLQYEVLQIRRHQHPFHAKGPGNEEDAEGIIRVLNALRKRKGVLYINCTVGTWAAPFWFRYADSVWRQENDFGTIGAGDNRDKRITYRDRLVHDVFVQGSPLMPINSMITHGLMVTKFGPPACMPRAPENVKKELRCAVACGTSFHELYVDLDLMNANGGVLWDELAKGIKWIRRNADVMDDVHWVGATRGTRIPRKEPCTAGPRGIKTRPRWPSGTPPARKRA